MVSPVERRTPSPWRTLFACGSGRSSQPRIGLCCAKSAKPHHLQTEDSYDTPLSSCDPMKTRRLTDDTLPLVRGTSERREKGASVCREFCIGICLTLFLVVVVGVSWYIWKQEQEAAVASPEQLATVEHATNVRVVHRLGVEIGLPRFRKLLLQRHLNSTAAWTALAGSAHNATWDNFKFFAQKVVDGMNETQAWWIFSEVDSNQDFNIGEAEFSKEMALHG